MKLKNTTRITQNYNIDEILKDKCLVTFIDLSSETIETKTIEEVEIIEYIYDSYQIELMNDEEYIKNNYDRLLVQAKQHEYDVLAYQVRAKRKALLEETDNYCLADRTPSQEMIDYRQALRDITSQEGFPYDVEYPTKPKEMGA